MLLQFNLLESITNFFTDSVYYKFLLNFCMQFSRIIGCFLFMTVEISKNRISKKSYEVRIISLYNLLNPANESGLKWIEIFFYPNAYFK